MDALNDLDEKLAHKYGRYASYQTPIEPVLETYGDAPADEVDRLLTIFAQPPSTILDLGCGAGQTLCRLKPDHMRVITYGASFLGQVRLLSGIAKADS
jgi:hypothetical protein